jgi:hypothetical protein
MIAMPPSPIVRVFLVDGWGGFWPCVTILGKTLGNWESLPLQQLFSRTHPSPDTSLGEIPWKVHNSLTSINFEDIEPLPIVGPLAANSNS